MAALLSPNAKQQFFTDGSTVAAGYKLYTYSANTANHQATFSNRAGTVTNANPIILDARGEATIYLTPGVVYDYVLKTDQDVTVWTREDVVADAGDANSVTFLQAGSGAVPRTVNDKAGETVSILDFGGLDDNVFDNTAAFQNAKARAGSNGVVRFPKSAAANAGIYYFATDPNLTGVVLDVEPRVALRGPLPLFDTYKVARSTAMKFTSNSTQDTLTPDYKRSYADMGIYMSPGDADRSNVVALATNTGFLFEKNDWPNSDTWVDDSGGGLVTADGPRVVWNALPNDGDLRAATCVVAPGDEITVAFVSVGTYQRFAVIRTTNGFHWVRLDASAISYIGSKLLSVAQAESSFVPLGSLSQDNFKPRNTTWSVRIYDRRSFSVLFNGIEVTGILATGGDIVRAGFGVIPSAAAQTMDTQGWVKWQNKDPGGKREVTALICGDSISAEHHGGWTGFFREALESTAGIRVKKLTNYSVAGDTSALQRDKLNSLGTGGASHVVIFVGTNDIQLGAIPVDTAGIIGQMLDTCDANFAVPVVCIPPLWYSKALTAGNTGEDTLRYAEGAETRARIMRLCASRSVKCVDMTQVTGPMLVEYLNDTTLGVDPFVRDNIHPTTFGNKVIGFAIARAILGSYVKAFSKRTDVTLLPTSGYANGWTALGGREPRYSINSDGEVQLRGLISAGTTTSGTTIYNLPAHLCPSGTVGTAAASSNAGTTCIVEAQADGQIKVYGATGLTYVYLDGIRFPT